MPPLRPEARIPKDHGRQPTSNLASYNDKRYSLYEPDDFSTLTDTPRPFTGSYRPYDMCKLYINAKLENLYSIPAKGVRLDDLTAFRGLYGFPKKGKKGFPAQRRNECYPAEFDAKGTIHATRYPLGRCAKIYASVGEIDIDGNTIEEGEQGWYYAWYRGLHMLPGAEGAHLYEIRPSFENFRCKDFSFKKKFKALVQEANGEEYYEGDEKNSVDASNQEVPKIPEMRSDADAPV